MRNDITHIQQAVYEVVSHAIRYAENKSATLADIHRIDFHVYAQKWRNVHQITFSILDPNVTMVILTVNMDNSTVTEYSWRPLS